MRQRILELHCALGRESCQGAAEGLTDCGERSVKFFGIPEIIPKAFAQRAPAFKLTYLTCSLHCLDHGDAVGCLPSHRPPCKNAMPELPRQPHRPSGWSLNWSSSCYWKLVLHRSDHFAASRLYPRAEPPRGWTSSCIGLSAATRGTCRSH